MTMDRLERRSRCRVCGWLFSGPIWDETEQHAEYEICPSCGCGAGNDDSTLEHTRQYRQEWIDSGMKWWCSFRDDPPPNWDPVEQMTHIPEEYR